MEVFGSDEKQPQLFIEDGGDGWQLRCDEAQQRDELVCLLVVVLYSSLASISLAFRLTKNTELGCQLQRKEIC